MISVTLDSMKHLTGFSEEERETIIEELMVVNPAYVSAKRYSKWSTVRIPQYLEYFREHKGVLTVPLHYNIPFKFTTKLDKRVENTVSYPKFHMKLRKTQREAYRAFLSDTDKGVIVLPTGKGKTVLGLYIASMLRQKTLILVHKDDLVESWKSEAIECFGGELTTGLIKAKSRKVGEQITIATIQTLNKLTDQEVEALSKEFGMIIVDEMHHIGAQVYDLISEFHAQYKIGLSATPERSDGMTQVMQFYLGELGYVYEYTLDDEDILPVNVVRRTVEVSYMPQVIEKVDRYDRVYYKYVPVTEEKNHQPHTLIDIDQVRYEDRPQIPFFTLDDIVLTEPLFYMKVCNDIVREVNMGRSCIAFFSQKKHIEQYRDLLVNLGVPEESILLYYGDNKDRRVQLKTAEDKSKIKVTLATYKIATEGTNVKAWEAGFLVSSLADGKNVEQAVGRIRRVCKGKLKTAVLYDYRTPNVYILSNHGAKRDSRYRALKFSNQDQKYQSSKSSMFSRGYKR